MALANRRLLRKPLLRTLIVLIRLLMPSAGPLLTFRMIALRIPHSPTNSLYTLQRPLEATVPKVARALVSRYGWRTAFAPGFGPFSAAQHVVLLWCQSP